VINDEKARDKIQHHHYKKMFDQLNRKKLLLIKRLLKNKTVENIPFNDIISKDLYLAGTKQGCLLSIITGTII
jgi:hypothetical protein